MCKGVKRSREGESLISLEYLKSCDSYHNNMLDISSSECVCQKQLVLNGNVDIYANEKQIQEWIADIDCFVKK